MYLTADIEGTIENIITPVEAIKIMKVINRGVKKTLEEHVEDFMELFTATWTDKPIGTQMISHGLRPLIKV